MIILKYCVAGNPLSQDPLTSIIQMYKPFAQVPPLRLKLVPSLDGWITCTQGCALEARVVLYFIPDQPLMSHQ